MKTRKKTLISAFLFIFILTASLTGWSIGANAATDDFEGPRPPVILLKGDLTIELNQGDTYTDPGWTALDDVDGNISSLVLVEGNPDTSQVGDHTISYTVSNQQGLSKTVTRLVRVHPAGTVLLEDGAVTLAGGAGLFQGRTGDPSIVALLGAGMVFFGIFIVLTVRLFGRHIKK